MEARELSQADGFIKELEGGMERYGVGVILFLSIIPNPVFDFMGIAAGALRCPLKKFLLVRMVR